MATLVTKASPDLAGFIQRDTESYTEYFQRTNRLLDKITAAANNLPDGEVLGAILSFPIADGYAMYRVASTKPLKLEHIPFGDAYRIDPITIRGLRLTDVQEMIQREKSFKALFKKPMLAGLNNHA